jgi:hypothetical protein
MTAATASHSRTPGAAASMPTCIAWETIAAAARIMAISAGDFKIRTQATSWLASTKRALGRPQPSSAWVLAV